jgi:hypothetical protein
MNAKFIKSAQNTELARAALKRLRGNKVEYSWCSGFEPLSMCCFASNRLSECLERGLHEAAFIKGNDHANEG